MSPACYSTFRLLENAGACELTRDDANKSSNEFLLRAADTTARVLPLPKLPVRDVRRFVFVPTLLRNRYGS